MQYFIALNQKCCIVIENFSEKMPLRAWGVTTVSIICLLKTLVTIYKSKWAVKRQAALKNLNDHELDLKLRRILKNTQRAKAVLVVIHFAHRDQRATAVYFLKHNYIFPTPCYKRHFTFLRRSRHRLELLNLSWDYKCGLFRVQPQPHVRLPA